MWKNWWRDLRGQLRLGCAVTSIARTPHGVIIHDSHGHRDAFDHVVMASHSDQTLAMLSDASSDEHAILGDIGYAPNVVYLHRDKRLMPKRRHAWASWNFLRWQRQGTTGSGTAAPLGSGGAAPFNDVAVTYWMNALQGIDQRQTAVRQPQSAVRTGSGTDVRSLHVRPSAIHRRRVRRAKTAR